ncbi:ead/Ea22-like family protein [Klebsiella pneumoniae]
MTDITELAQRMKAAAEKLDADQWQTRKGFSGIEVIVKGSLEKGHGCVSFQPVAADMADTKTARAIALFSPANVLALVEALEKAQQRIAELESRTVKLPKPHAHLIWIQAGHAPDDYWDDVAVSHSEKDRCCDGSERYPVYARWEIEEMLAAAGIKVEAD